MQHTLRVWDLPTRLFHWSLAATCIALVATAKLGGNAMQWHMRLGLLMLALLVFRLAWGLVGGYWSRFARLLYSPAQLWRHLSGRGDKTRDDVGHTPLGALSVLTLLALLLAQVCSGLLSDDEIAFAGPLTRFVPGDWVSLASWYHKDLGQYLLWGCVALHLCAIAFYTFVRRRPLVRAMIRGDKQLPPSLHVPPSRDDLPSRLRAAGVLTMSCLLAWWVASLGS